MDSGRGGRQRRRRGSERGGEGGGGGRDTKVKGDTALLHYVQTSRYSDNKTMNCHKIDGFLVILDHVSHSNVEDGKE